VDDDHGMPFESDLLAHQELLNQKANYAGFSSPEENEIVKVAK
jgi:hypothetical protein